MYNIILNILYAQRKESGFLLVWQKHTTKSSMGLLPDQSGYICHVFVKQAYMYVGTEKLQG